MAAVVNKYRLYSRCSLILLLTLIISLGSGHAAAIDSPAKDIAQKPGITISPTQKEIIVSSGLIETTTYVTITNNTGRSLTGSLKLLDFKSLDETGGLLFGQSGLSTDQYGLAHWMSLPNGDVINVPDGHDVVIPVHIVNQPDLAPGAHYGAVVVTFGGPAVQGGSQAGFKQEMVSLLFVNKRGGERFGLQLQSLSVQSGGLPDIARLRFKSTGNVYEVPHGYITVTNDSGVVVAKGIINPESSLVLPGTTREFITPLKIISLTHTKTRHYTVTAYYRSDEQTQFSNSSIRITLSSALPVLVLEAVSTGAIGLLLLLLLHRKVLNRGRKSKRRSRN